MWLFQAVRSLRNVSIRDASEARDRLRVIKGSRTRDRSNLRFRQPPKLIIIEAATSLENLRFPPGNRLAHLKGDRAGLHSIRVNDQFRVCFRWTETGADGVKITDYH